MALLQRSSGSSEEVQVLPYGCWVLHDRVNGFWIDDPEEPWSKATLNHKAPVAVGGAIYKKVPWSGSTRAVSYMPHWLETESRPRRRKRDYIPQLVW